MDSSSSSSISSSSSDSSGSLSAGDLEAGFSGSPAPGAPLPLYANRRRASNRSMRGSPRLFFCEPFDDEPHHFLDSCFLCKKPLAGNRDIFMYRGDTPFCSEECRKEQIEIDEAREKNWKVSASLKASSRKEQQQQQKGGASSPTKSQKIHVRAGTVVAG